MRTLGQAGAEESAVGHIDGIARHTCFSGPPLPRSYLANGRW